MKRKGQAAVEFLMTYGWAILAAVIAIGVLAYFGVFSPGKYVSGTAIVNAPFYVNAWNVKTTAPNGVVSLELRNNGGEDYNVWSVTVDNCGTLDLTAAPITVVASDKESFPVPCDVANTLIGQEGNTLKGDITIAYRKAGSDIDLTSTGTIAEKITA